MNSGGAIDIVAELPLIYLAAGALGLPILILWLNTVITRKPASPLAQAMVMINCATGCIILLTFASAFLPPGSFDAKSTSLGPFTIEAKGQAATMLVATFSIFGAVAVVVNFIYKHIPAPPPSPAPPENPDIQIETRTRPPDNPQVSSNS